jgi:hypothetical protein
MFGRGGKTISGSLKPLVLALVLTASVAGIAAAPAVAAETTKYGSLITFRDGIAYPGQVFSDTHVSGAVQNNEDWWTKAVTVNRFLKVKLATFTAAPGYNSAKSMRAQVNVRRWNGNTWVDICWNPTTSTYWTYPSGCPSNYRFPARNGFVSMSHGSDVYGLYAWMFSNEGGLDYEIPGLPSGHYRVYVWYWYFDSAGRTIGRMIEYPAQSDYRVGYVDGAPDASVGNASSTTAGWITLN